MALHYTPRIPRADQIRELEQEWASNPRWKDVKRGYTATDVVNLRGTIPHRSMLAAHGADKLWDYLQNEDFINSLGAVTGEFTDRDGRVFEIRKNPTPHGGMVIFGVDISDQKAVEANLIKSKQDVEAASRAKSSFLANMSHEFRTPLHGIMGFSDLILQIGSDDEIKEFAEQIKDSSVHLLEIINTVLAYSRLEAGQHPFESSELLEVAA